MGHKQRNVVISVLIVIIFIIIAALVFNSKHQSESNLQHKVISEKIDSDTKGIKIKSDGRDVDLKLVSESNYKVLADGYFAKNLLSNKKYLQKSQDTVTFDFTQKNSKSIENYSNKNGTIKMTVSAKSLNVVSIYSSGGDVTIDNSSKIPFSEKVDVNGGDINKKHSNPAKSNLSLIIHTDGGDIEQ